VTATRVVKIVSVVLAIHLVFIAFFFYKPPAIYFGVTCVSTIIVWSAVFAVCSRKKWLGIIGGALVQLFAQQVASHLWLGNLSPLWPIVQFVSLQYIIVMRLKPSGNDPLGPPAD
jgi:hypothetical protein